ncbi:MAG: hypothetical protein QGH06_09155, partial [Lutibacter sp.]|nr:hypothetical protein [Lutibacter sp.]
SSVPFRSSLGSALKIEKIIPSARKQTDDSPNASDKSFTQHYAEEDGSGLPISLQSTLPYQ